MTPTIYVGIDNGVSGAIAIIHPDGDVEVGKMPVIDLGGRRLINCIKVRRILDNARRLLPNVNSVMHVIFEHGQIIPTNGSRTHFAQGYSFGVLSATLLLSGIPCTAVNPKEWQKEMHLGIRKKGQDTKDASLEACRRLYPNVSLLPTPRCTKPDDGMAEALLMATWGKRHNL